MEWFSVYQYFIDKSYEKVVELVSAEQAIEVVKGLINSVGGQIGTTQRIIIIDEWDCVNFEWIYGKGITFPTQKNLEEQS